VQDRDNHIITEAEGDALQLSVVVPFYNSVGSLDDLYERLVTVLEKAVASFEIILVDDRSTDDIWPKLDALSRRDPRVVSIRLSRNFGQQLAISAGLAESRGNAVVVMDCDLQDPPELIPLMIEESRDADILLMRRQSDYHGRLRLLASSMYFRMLSILCGVEFQSDLGSFSLITRKVVKAFGQFGDIDRHYVFILLWLGFKQKSLTYKRDRRHSGGSAYGLRSLVDLAISGIFFQTTVFLKWVILGGALISLLGVLGGLWHVLIYLSGIRPPPGWTSLIVVNLILGGVIIVSVGTVGLYVAKIFELSKSRPLYVVDEVCNRRSS
jgi:dolichol-phosphate mannosyltransferase